MTEKAVVLSSRTAKTKTGSILAGGAWAAAGLLMEVSSGGGSVGASALAAGVTAANGIWIYAGGIVGALLKGFPGGYIGIGGLAIVLAGRLIPQVRNVRIKCVIQGLLAAAAAFFSACAEYTSPSALLSGIISAFTAGIFAACVLLLYDRASVRGFDISDPGDCALGAVAAGIAFMSLGGLELPFCNVGRLLAGFLLLAATERKGVQGAVLGIPAVCGLCISGGTNMPGVGVIALAAVTSCFLSRYGRITRAVGYLFSDAPEYSPVQLWKAPGAFSPSLQPEGQRSCLFRRSLSQEQKRNAPIFPRQGCSGNALTSPPGRWRESIPGLKPPQIRWSVGTLRA